MPQCSDYNFIKFRPDCYLITNMAGRYLFLNEAEFNAYTVKRPLQHTVKALENNYFYSEQNKEAFISDYASAIRNYRDYLFAGTGLHIFVLTSECNLNCLYCQASTHQYGHMMEKEIAKKCVDLALQSPNKYLSFEFQGGEPLLSFETMKFIVQYTEKHKRDKEVEFNLVSNLTLLNDEIIEFINRHHICISTSLDGNKALQNINRPSSGDNTYDIWKRQFDRLNDAIEWKIGAIQTTTKYSLYKYKEIVDEYIANGLETVFIRPLTPLGYAKARWDDIGYSAEEFIDFYKNALDYIIKRAKNGVKIREGHAVIFLKKILGHSAGNYTELRSPCGAALGQLAYNYDGNIYTCDEGRMMAEMGDYSFKVGNINSQYIDLVNGNVCKAMAVASCLESIPQCAECVYSPYCGVCPVLNYATGGNLFADSPNTFRCKVYKGMLDSIFSILFDNQESILEIVNEWGKV